MAFGLTCPSSWRDTLTFINYSREGNASHVNTSLTSTVGEQNSMNKMKVFSPVVVYQSPCNSSKETPHDNILPSTSSQMDVSPTDSVFSDGPYVTTKDKEDTNYIPQDVNGRQSNRPQERTHSFREACVIPTSLASRQRDSKDFSDNFLAWNNYESPRGDTLQNDFHFKEKTSKDSHYHATEQTSRAQTLYRSAFHRPSRNIKSPKCFSATDNLLQNWQHVQPHNSMAGPSPGWFPGYYQNSLTMPCGIASPTNTFQNFLLPVPESNYYHSKTMSKGTPRCKNLLSSVSKDSAPDDPHRVGPLERSRQIGNSHDAKRKKETLSSSADRPFKCQCGRAFARNEELTRHRRIHSGYKPHRCHICNKTFGRKDHLNKHVKTHLHSSQKKVHLCDLAECGQTYTRSDALARHQMNSHGIRAKPSKWRPQ